MCSSRKQGRLRRSREGSECARRNRRAGSNVWIIGRSSDTWSLRKKAKRIKRTCSTGLKALGDGRNRRSGDKALNNCRTRRKKAAKLRREVTEAGKIQRCHGLFPLCLCSPQQGNRARRGERVQAARGVRRSVHEPPQSDSGEAKEDEPEESAAVDDGQDRSDRGLDDHDREERDDECRALKARCLARLHRRHATGALTSGPAIPMFPSAVACARSAS